MKEEYYYFCSNCEYDKIKYMDVICPNCGFALEWSMVESPSLPEDDIIEKHEIKSSREILIVSDEALEKKTAIKPPDPEKKIEPPKKENAKSLSYEDKKSGENEIDDDSELRSKIYDFVYSLKKNIIPLSEHARVKRKYTSERKKRIIKLYREIKHNIKNVSHKTECIYCKGKNARIVLDGPEYVGCVCTNCNPPSSFDINYDFLDFLDKKEDKNENN